MSPSRRDIAISAGIGLAAYLTFAAACRLLSPAIFPDQPSADPLIIRLNWLLRLLFEKSINLALLIFAGLALGYYLRRKPVRLILPTILTIAVYQGICITSLIWQFGYAYYRDNHTFLSTLWTSFVFCWAASALASWLALRGKMEHPLPADEPPGK